MAFIIVNWHSISLLFQRLFDFLPKCFYLMRNAVPAILHNRYTPYHSFSHHIIERNTGDCLYPLALTKLLNPVGVSFVNVTFVNADFGRHVKMAADSNDSLQVMYP